jgi:hypothetical protein
MTSSRCRTAVEAAALGELGFFSPEQCRGSANAEGIRGRAQRMWLYFSQPGARWDRQPGTGAGPLA